MIDNQHALLDPQSPDHALAVVHTEELAATSDAAHARELIDPNACPVCGDSACDGGCDHGDNPLHDAAAYAHEDAPDAHLDAAYEERTELEDY